eukprot:m.469369 g.469369  ORF g.469369 m.469369 type:complete len:818 (-) comp28448_c0_seq1:9-2462(-)
MAEPSSALLTAAASGSLHEVEAILADEACDVNAEDALGGTALHKAAGRKGAVGPQLIRRLVSGNARLDHQDNGGRTALHAAIAAKQQETLKVLIELNANLNITDESGATPLAVAASQRGALPLAKILVSKGADVTITNADGKSPLSWAVQWLDHDLVADMLDLGAQANIKLSSSSDMPPLCVAIQRKDAGIAKLLLNAGANPSAQCFNKWTPLIFAANMRPRVAKKGEVEAQVQIAQMLIEANADLDMQDLHGNTALFHSAAQNSPRMVTLLVEAGCNVHLTTKKGKTALDAAKQADSSEIVKLLGGSEDKLFEAIRQDNIAEVTELLTGNMDLEAVGREGATPLLLSVALGLGEIANLLVKCGSDLRSENNEGRQVADIDPWLVMESVKCRLQPELADMTAAQFLKIIRTVPAALLFCVDDLGPDTSVLEKIGVDLTASFVDMDDSNEALSTVNLLLREFVDEPLETLRKADKWSPERLRIPEWLKCTIIQAASGAIDRVLKTEQATLTANEDLVASYSADAEMALADDRSIYSAVFEKMTNKHPAESDTLFERARDTREVIKKEFAVRPTQPALDATSATVLDLKVQAAQSYARFSSMVESMFAEIKSASLITRVAPTLKRSERILQKWWLRKELISVCDVVRALVTVPDFSEMLTVHNHLATHQKIRIVDFKDRLNTRTSGGWADLVYLFRIPCQDSEQVPQPWHEHIYELQVALEPMVTARSALHGHAAYAAARHKMEMLDVLGIRVSTSVETVAPTETTEVRLARVLAENERLQAELSRVVNENDALRLENTNLRVELESARAQRAKALHIC